MSFLSKLFGRTPEAPPIADEADVINKMRKEHLFTVRLLSVFLSRENPDTIALILLQLAPAQAAGVFGELSEELKGDVAYRMAQLGDNAPQMLREIEEGLTQELRALLLSQITDMGGTRAVAEILNRTDRSIEKAVLESLDTKNAELAEKVRNQMFVFDDIVKLTDREIQMMLREVDTKDLAVALKGASEELKDRILGNVSERVGTMIKEEMQFSGPVRKSDVEDVQLRVVQTVRQLEEAGQVTIVRGDPDFV